MDLLLGSVGSGLGCGVTDDDLVAAAYVRMMACYVLWGHDFTSGPVGGKRVHSLVQCRTGDF